MGLLSKLIVLSVNLFVCLFTYLLTYLRLVTPHNAFDGPDLPWRGKREKVRTPLRSFAYTTIGWWS